MDFSKLSEENSNDWDEWTRRNIRALKKNSSARDVTLYCKDKEGKLKFIKVHSKIISGYSKQLKEICDVDVNNNKDVHVTGGNLFIYLKDIQFEYVEKLVEFMYEGKIVLHGSELEYFKKKGFRGSNFFETLSTRYFAIFW